MLGNPITTDDIDLVIGEKVGWRAWDLTVSYGQPLLTSPSQGTLWTPGDNIAVCRHATREQRQNCHCGFNAYDDRAKLESSGYGYSGPIIGTVHLHGEVTQYEDGYRGQYARVKELWIDASIAEHAEALSQRYGCPVHVEKEPRLTPAVTFGMGPYAGARPAPAPTNRPIGMPQSALTRSTSWSSALAAAALTPAPAPVPAPAPAPAPPPPTLRHRARALPRKIRDLAGETHGQAVHDREDAHWFAQIAIALIGVAGFALWWILRNDSLNEQSETALMNGRELGYWSVVQALAPATLIAALGSIALAATLIALIKLGKIGAMSLEQIIEASGATLLILMVFAFAVPAVNTYSSGREGAVDAGLQAWDARQMVEVPITRANVRQWGSYMDLKMDRCMDFTVHSAKGADLEATMCRAAKHRFEVGNARWMP